MKEFPGAIVLALALACAKSEMPRPDSVSVAAASATPVDSGTYTLADFRRLRWIEGRWRGFMPNGEKFYESYRFHDDSTLSMYEHADSSFGPPKDTSHILLRRGIVSDSNARSRYVATRLDSAGVDFAPVRGATNHFTWAREDSTKWNATIRWTDREGRPQSVMYALHRFGR